MEKTTKLTADQREEFIKELHAFIVKCHANTVPFDDVEKAALSTFKVRTDLNQYMIGKVALCPDCGCPQK